MPGFDGPVERSFGGASCGPPFQSGHFPESFRQSGFAEHNVDPDLVCGKFQEARPDRRRGALQEFVPRQIPTFVHAAFREIPHDFAILPAKTRSHVEGPELPRPDEFLRDGLGGFRDERVRGHPFLGGKSSGFLRDHARPQPFRQLPAHQPTDAKRPQGDRGFPEAPPRAVL